MNEEENILEKIICLGRIAQDPVSNTTHDAGVTAKQDSQGFSAPLADETQQSFVSCLRWRRNDPSCDIRMDGHRFMRRGNRLDIRMS